MCDRNEKKGHQVDVEIIFSSLLRIEVCSEFFEHGVRGLVLSGIKHD